MLGPFATTSRLTPIQQMSLAVLPRAACASMSTTTTTTRDRGDRYGPMEWAQWTLPFPRATSLHVDFVLNDKQLPDQSWVEHKYRPQRHWVLTLHYTHAIPALFASLSTFKATARYLKLRVHDRHEKVELANLSNICTIISRKCIFVTYSR